MDVAHLPVPARHHRRRMLPILAAAALLIGGCGSTASDEPAIAEPNATPRPTTQPSTSSKPAQALTVQQLADALGCQATLAGKAADFRQATCIAAGAQFVLLDFDTVKSQRDWLDLAVSYGGVYLVGDRWALSGKSKEYLQTLQTTLGGTIEENGAHGHGGS